MDIFFSATDSYLKQLLVCMVSVLENNRKEQLNFHILSSDMTAQSFSALESLKGTYTNFTVEKVNVAVKNIDDFPLPSQYITKETYYRLFIADLCPQLKKALYIDVDTFVNGSLRPLWDEPLDGYLCAGIEDLYILKIGFKEVLGLTDADLYVNGGVLLMNLDQFREERICEKIYPAMLEIRDKIKFLDQDLINTLFRGKIKAVDSVFNYASINLKKEPKKMGDAVIVHFTGAKKPWMDECTHPMTSAWRYYAGLNPMTRAWCSQMKPCHSRIREFLIRKFGPSFRHIRQLRKVNS